MTLCSYCNLHAQNPRSKRAAQAPYSFGKCEFARKNYLDAEREFELVVQIYPKSEFAPKAHYKKGVSLQQGGKKMEAREAFRRLEKEFPRHELAKSAHDQLSE